ncbi:PREDICTED: protein bric-a-brac 2 [Nicrophorus vespilloides]|uniref:Protein bric-a-brac 2 n=1 Tax=Nicrophorus vespilloides TaxID=110193 RepID=A0ABM1MZW8_NICVS|nr:PREDICTED: protein bric-a-brac 2 [Nicrophorus vespilloides]XP_017780127.1 PREDICTED: protein bric-a-brac 2 [Nicrophorus vespilloides]XP_017780136.1 PREDICTED: protein bric-a-brac 2 [Nicrophorus vespilloides]XP_017780145.1 PREDICTED: protein bric-a-brac 2 [Nicrophorus vespilloides]XP_017780154.1 PREDICTED: protein bric-a-brac 2 [Nicrophorus vespilloides]
MVTPPQQFCVRWNSYQSNLQNAFPKLLISEHFVDVTLACENEMLKCHKVVLSACSTYFEKLLLQNPCQHPIIFMKDMKFQEMQSLVDFMYKGEVNVTQDDLPSLLKSAEALQIRGLCGSDQLLSQQNLNNIKTSSTPKTSQEKPVTNANAKVSSDQPQQTQQNQSQQQQTQTPKGVAKKEEKTDTQQTAASADGTLNPSSSECDSNDASTIIKEELDIKEEYEDAYYDGEGDLMDTEFTEEDGPLNNSLLMKSPDYAIANVSCQYDGSPGSTSRRVRRSDEELRRAAECITRGQTFQTVSDQFNIPISTIRFYMARKGILPRRKRGRACSGASMSPSISPSVANSYGSSGNTSPIGPPYHIVHYKLPHLGVSKLK